MNCLGVGCLLSSSFTWPHWQRTLSYFTVALKRSVNFKAKSCFASAKIKNHILVSKLKSLKLLYKNLMQTLIHQFLGIIDLKYWFLNYPAESSKSPTKIIYIILIKDPQKMEVGTEVLSGVEPCNKARLSYFMHINFRCHTTTETCRR